MLAIEVQKRLGEFLLEAEVRVPAGGTLVVVGRSGAGKTTLLRLVAGLLAPDRGRIALGDRILADAHTRAWLAPEDRGIGYVPQDSALFPHLTVRENVAFGLSRVDAAERRTRVDAALDRLGLRELEGRKRRQLSGGQQQRVALARALVTRPAALLLDEPLAALDVETRRRTRAEVADLTRELGCVTLYVTHQAAEALLFGEQIAVLEDGRVTQVGGREDLLQRPRTRHVAEFLGTNLFEAAEARAEPSGLLRLAVGESAIFALGEPVRGRVFAVVDPREVTLLTVPQATSAQNVLRGRVEEIQLEPPRGDRVRVRVGSDPPIVAELSRAAAQSLGLAPGREVWASFKAAGVRLFQ